MPPKRKATEPAAEAPAAKRRKTSQGNDEAPMEVDSQPAAPAKRTTRVAGKKTAAAAAEPKDKVEAEEAKVPARRAGKAAGAKKAGAKAAAAKKASTKKAAEPLEELPELPLPFFENNVGLIKTVKELRMMTMSAAIRSKPDWWVKMDKAEIATKWRKEAADQGATSDMIDYVFKELKYYRTLRGDGPIEPSGVDGVWQAVGLVPAALRQKLIQGVAPLENVPADQKDWHPGSNNLVLDLVHPSLYCLAFGTTVAQREAAVLPDLPSATDAAVIPNPVFEEGEKSFSSTRFQWIPSEFDVDVDGNVAITSYINNLHPTAHKGLYDTIGSVFETMVPLFERTLTYSAYNYFKTRRTDVPLELMITDYQDDYEDVILNSEKEALREIGVKKSVQKVYDSPDPVDLKGRKLQVIVKLANIELTPQKPTYPGGSWHVEGMLNERIVASGIYYYQSENIRESRLAFRQGVENITDRRFNSGTNYQRIFGLDDNGSLNQSLGSVETVEGLCLTFPNVYQHQVQPFQLKDRKKPGHRKILVFFLVDPMTQVPSTAYIPPQQPDWKAGGEMTLETALANREALMEERKASTKEVTKRFEAHSGAGERQFSYSFCEH